MNESNLLYLARVSLRGVWEVPEVSGKDKDKDGKEQSGDALAAMSAADLLAARSAAREKLRGERAKAAAEAKGDAKVDEKAEEQRKLVEAATVAPAVDRCLLAAFLLYRTGRWLTVEAIQKLATASPARCVLVSFDVSHAD